MNDGSLLFKTINIEGFEQVIEVINEHVHLHGIIVIHNSKLGPACGGIRVYPYAAFDEALTDALRLAKGMTYKAAVAQTGTGGAKGVIIIDQFHPKSKEMLLAFAEAINLLQGRFLAAEDVGTSVEDLDLMHQVTPYVVGLSKLGSSGNPAIFTARGGFRGIQAVCQKIWNTPSVRGKKIAIQGLGSVGSRLLQHLFWEGAKLIVTYIRDELVEEAANRWGVATVSPDEIYTVDCDIFSPTAMGGILNKETIPQLRCKAVAGIANNQLLKEEDADRLAERNILYAPDFVINAGGLLNVSSEIRHETYNPEWVRERVDGLYDLLLSIFQQAEQMKCSPHHIAVKMAE